jgi:hypothetical protein
MLREMDLIRQILFKMEENPEGFAPQNLAVEGFTTGQIAHHIWLLGDDGTLVAENGMQ